MFLCIVGILSWTFVLHLTLLFVHPSDLNLTHQLFLSLSFLFLMKCYHAWFYCWHMMIVSLSIHPTEGFFITAHFWCNYYYQHYHYYSLSKCYLVWSYPWHIPIVSNTLYPSFWGLLYNFTPLIQLLLAIGWPWDFSFPSGASRVTSVNNMCMTVWCLVWATMYVIAGLVYR